MKIEQDGWIIYRQIGIGERQHVRSGLLGVLFPCATDIVEQIAGAIRAANSLGMMLRAHIPMDKLPASVYKQVLNLMYDNAAHQLESWAHLSDSELSSVIANSEIVVERTEAAKNTRANLEVGVLSVWAKSGGRFLQGNHGGLDESALRYRYPEFYHDQSHFKALWNE